MSVKHSSQFLPTLFITALRGESKALMKRLRFEKIQHSTQIPLFKLTQNPVYLMEVGMGPSVSKESIIQVIREVQSRLLIKLGVCGALNPKYSLFDFFLVEKVCSQQGQMIDLLSTLPLELKSITEEYSLTSLLTAEKPVTNKNLRNELYQSTGCSLVDLEAFHVAEIAEELKLPLIVFKLVSDRADELASVQVKRNLQRIQEKLGKEIIGFIKKYLGWVRDFPE